MEYLKEDAKVGEFSATLPTLFWMTTNSDQHKSFKLVLCLASFYYESVEQTITDQFWKKSPLEKKSTSGPFETWKNSLKIVVTLSEMEQYNTFRKTNK